MEALWVVLPAGQRASGEWIDDTLRRRAEESGLLSRTPLAGKFPRQRVVNHLARRLVESQGKISGAGK